MPNILKGKYNHNEAIEELRFEENTSANSVDVSEIESRLCSFHLEDVQTPHYDPFNEEPEEFSLTLDNPVMMANSNPVRKMPVDLKDLVPRYMGNSKLTAQFFRQIRTAFEDADIELTPKCFFNVIIMRVGGDALEVLEQNRRMVQCMDDSSCAKDDDVIACRDLLMTQFAPIEMEQKNDWMAELDSFRQEKSETLTSYYNRAVALMKNLKLVDGNRDGSHGKVEITPAEKHLLKTLCMAYYMGLNDPVLKRRVFQVKGWSKCTSLLQMHTLVTEEKNDMEEQDRVEHELKNAECVQMLRDLQAGSITKADMNTFMATMGSNSSSSSNNSVPSPRTHFFTDTAQISNRRRCNPTQVENSQSNHDHQSQQQHKSKISQPNSQRSDLYKNRHEKNQIMGSPSNNLSNYHALSHRKMEIPAGYDRSTSSNPYVNGSRIVNGEQICLICGNSGHVAARGGLNCSPDARRLDLIESAIIRSLLFPNDRDVEANMTLIHSRYYNDNYLDAPSNSQKVPQFIPDNIDSHMFQCDDRMTRNSQSSGESKKGNLSNDLEKINFDVFGYEPAGSKRVRIV